MQTELFPLQAPQGWTLDTYEGLNGRQFTRAIDPDGLRWYEQDGAWILNVPYFRSGTAGKDLAICDSVDDGGKAYPIDAKGVIYVKGRRITSKEWNH